MGPTHATWKKVWHGEATWIRGCDVDHPHWTSCTSGMVECFVGFQTDQVDHGLLWTTKIASYKFHHTILTFHSKKVVCVLSKGVVSQMAHIAPCILQLLIMIICAKGVDRSLYEGAVVRMGHIVSCMLQLLILIVHVVKGECTLFQGTWVWITNI